MTKLQHIKLGIVGQRGAALVAGFRSMPEVEVTALCETDRDRLRKEGHALEIERLYTEFQDMLPAVDAVVVATPMQLHAAQSIQALDAGKHVLCEVTAAVSLDECRQLRAAVDRSNLTYMMSENYCYMQDNMLVLEIVRRGYFGELYFGEGEYLHEVRNLHHNADGSPTWRARWQVGSRGCTYPTHSLGPVMQWFQAIDPTERIESVSCFGTGVHTDPDHPHDDTCLMLCHLASGKLIKIRLDMMSNRPHHMAYYTLQGTTGVYETSRMEEARGHIWLGESRDGDTRRWQPISDFDNLLPEPWRSQAQEAARTGHAGSDYFVAQDFIRAIRTGEKPQIDVNRALEWTAAGLCSQISIENGGIRVKVPTFI